MPWSELRPMDQRILFIADHLRRLESVSALCERYGISRKTGYKWIERYGSGGGGRPRRARAQSALPGAAAGWDSPGDIVLCQCPTPPRIVALVAGENWSEDMGARDGAYELLGSGNAGFTATGGPVSESFDELVIAVSPSGPIADYPYFVETTDGRGLFGHHRV